MFCMYWEPISNQSADVLYKTTVHFLHLLVYHCISDALILSFRCKNNSNSEFSSEVFLFWEHHLYGISALAWTTKTGAFVKVYWSPRPVAAAKCLSTSCPFRPQPASKNCRSADALFKLERRCLWDHAATSGGARWGLPSKSVLRLYVCILSTSQNRCLH